MRWEVLTVAFRATKSPGAAFDLRYQPHRGALPVRSHPPHSPGTRHRPGSCPGLLLLAGDDRGRPRAVRLYTSGAPAKKFWRNGNRCCCSCCSVHSCCGWPGDNCYHCCSTNRRATRRIGSAPAANIAFLKKIFGCAERKRKKVKAQAGAAPRKICSDLCTKSTVEGQRPETYSGALPLHEIISIFLLQIFRGAAPA
ncbi:MAG: hypothetical protein EPGJADBJ_00593 [Saprospiraceae bacterium]|nr:hypothetical protein [Saprospiraceae bacterium]